MNSKQIMSINIPNDWSFVPIYDLRNKNDRYSFTGGPFGSDLKSEHYTDNGVRVIQLQNIGEGKFYDDNKVYTSEEKANQLKTCLIYPDEIILAKMFPAGRSCKIPQTEEKFLMCSDGIRLSVDRSKYNNDFVYQALNTTYFLKAVQSQSTGTTRSRIGLNDLKIIPIAIPNSLPEQQKIADILTTVDDKLENIESQIAEYTNLKTGLMQQLLTKGIGHTKFVDSELGMIPEGWDVVKLGDCAEINMGQSPESKFYNDNGDGNYLIQGNADIKNRQTSPRIWTSNLTKECKIGDIIMTVRAPVGAIAKSLHNACIGRGVCSIKPKEINAEFLYQFLISYESKWTALVQGSTFTAVNGKDIRGIAIPKPPTQEQQKIADILSSVDEKIQSLQQKSKEFTNLKKGLMEQLLTGRVRVKA